MFKSFLTSFSGVSVLMFASSTLLATVSMAAEAPTPTASSVTAATPKMSCAIGVYKAKDFLDEDQDQNELFQIVSVDLPETELDFDQEFQVRGETLLMSLRKFEFADVYEFSARLTSATPSPTGYLAIYNDHIVNDGPTKGAWDINPGPNATRFAYLQRQGGGIGLSRDMVTALRAEGLWGKHPFTSSTLSVMGADLTETVEALVKNGKLKADDVVGIAALLSCSLER